MTPDEAREELIASWLQMSADALASAQSERDSGRGRFAINRSAVSLRWIVRLRHPK